MKATKEKAWKYYKRWRREKTYSPALKSEVKISLKGWRHLTGATGYKKRPFKDVYRRLKLLPHAKAIIKKSTTIQNITTRNKRKYYALEAVVPVKEAGKTQPRKVRVILQEDKTGDYIFFSVMDKKKRRRKKKKS